MENIQSPDAAQPDEPAVYQPLNLAPPDEAPDDDPNETFLAYVRQSFFDDQF